MNVEQRKRVIQGIVLIKFIHFLGIRHVFHKTLLFFLGDGKSCRLFFQHVSARTGWDSCLMILHCTGIFSFGIYRICVKPLSEVERKSAEI